MYLSEQSYSWAKINIPPHVSSTTEYLVTLSQASTLLWEEYVAFNTFDMASARSAESKSAFSLLHSMGEEVRNTA